MKRSGPVARLWRAAWPSLAVIAGINLVPILWPYVFGAAWESTGFEQPLIIIGIVITAGMVGLELIDMHLDWYLPREAARQVREERRLRGKRDFEE